jgi:hypothetical protein
VSAVIDEHRHYGDFSHEVLHKLEHLDELIHAIDHKVDWIAEQLAAGMSPAEVEAVRERLKGQAEKLGGIAQPPAAE